MYVNLAWAQLEEEAQYKLFLSLQSELLSFSFFMRRLSARSIISRGNVPGLGKKLCEKRGDFFIDIITPFTKTFLKGGHWILRCWLHAIPLTEGKKNLHKRPSFFLTNDGELEKRKKRHLRYQPQTVPLLKQKGKVLRNQTRRAVQDEVHPTATHQCGLHENLQAQGLAKFSKNGVGYSDKEGK